MSAVRRQQLALFVTLVVGFALLFAVAQSPVPTSPNTCSCYDDLPYWLQPCCWVEAFKAVRVASVPVLAMIGTVILGAELKRQRALRF